MKQIFIIAGVGAFLLILGIVFYIVIKNSKKSKTSVDNKTKSSKKADKKVDELDLLLDIAKNSSSIKELNDAAIRFISSQNLGDKKSGNLSEDLKKKLGFISAISANTSSTPKLISFLNLELGKKYPQFKREIDLYENMGIARRRMKKA